MIINRNSGIIAPGASKPVRTAIAMLERDMRKVFDATDVPGVPIVLKRVDDLPVEQFRIVDGTIEAGDDLGFIYGLLHISEHALGVEPFWFWLDQPLAHLESAQVEDYESQPKPVRLRGWFINDEDLFNGWSPDDDPLGPWKMTCEALLRCGGNMIIPTTQIKRPQQHLAAGYGLKLTHHHAEPLGADMYAKRFPGEDPSYDAHPERYARLWRDAIREQSDTDVVWTLNFRGQGDFPFWFNDPAYDTDEKRGALIGRIMQRQYDILKEELGHEPTCCVYVYGEVMEFYTKGFLKLPDGVIRVYADNGYGKMVSRRMDLDNPRIPAIQHDGERNGIYYHVSYSDLRTCAHITQLANSNAFLNRELDEVLAAPMNDYWVVNCSNVRPHVWELSLIADKWNGVPYECADFNRRFGEAYFGDAGAACAFDDYASAAVAFGEHEDEHAGDHFPNFSVRALLSDWMRGRDTSPYMFYATGERPLDEQVAWFADRCREGVGNYRRFLDGHRQDYGPVHRDTIMMNARLMLHGYQGGQWFCEAYRLAHEGQYMRAFYAAGLAAEEFAAGDALMRSSESGAFVGFYANECHADFKFTACLLRGLMGWIRNFSDGPGFWDWQRALFYTQEEKGVSLQLNLYNRQTDEECFARLRRIVTDGGEVPAEDTFEHRWRV